MEVKNVLLLSFIHPNLTYLFNRALQTHTSPYSLLNLSVFCLKAPDMQCKPISLQNSVWMTTRVIVKLSHNILHCLSICSFGLTVFNYTPPKVVGTEYCVYAIGVKKKLFKLKKKSAGKHFLFYELKIIFKLLLIKKKKKY